MANFQVERLKRLPQRAGEVWIGGIIRLPAWVDDGRKAPYRPGAAVWVSLETKKISMTEPGEDVDFAAAFDGLVAFAAGPDAGYRPGRLGVNDAGLAEYLSGLLAEAGIRVEHDAALPELDQIMSMLGMALAQNEKAFAKMMPQDEAALEALLADEEALKKFFDSMPGPRADNPLANGSLSGGPHSGGLFPDDLDMADFFGGDVPPPSPGYLTGKGVTVARMRAFAEAAALFYQAAPWQHFANEDLIEIESPTPPHQKLQCVVVMGGGGVEFGLGFYRSTKHYWDSTRPEDDMDERFAVMAEGGGVWSVMFDNITTLPFADADLWQDNKLPVAGKRAYPQAMRYELPTRHESPMKTSRPDAKTLAYFEGLMRALAATTEDEMDTGRWTKTVTTADGPATFTLSLPFLLNPPSREERKDYDMIDRRAYEVVNLQIDRFLEGKKFSSDAVANKTIQKEFGGKYIDPAKYPPRTPMEAAAILCYQAFDSIGRRRVALARKAMQACPDYADAYVILAEHARTADEANKLYAAGVAAGRRALGEQFFKENTGEFWQAVNTRPFMRALHGLAKTQLALAQPNAAIASLQELLRLNPIDNQGARYSLLPTLITQGQLKQAEKLHADYKEDDAATWQYCRALLTFATEGNTLAARRDIQAALAANRHAAAQLLNSTADGASGGESVGVPPTGTSADQPFSAGPPLEESEAYDLGSPEEAVICATECAAAWRAVPNALDWLKANTKKSPRLLQRQRQLQRKKTKKRKK